MDSSTPTTVVFRFVHVRPGQLPDPVAPKVDLRDPPKGGGRLLEDLLRVGTRAEKRSVAARYILSKDYLDVASTMDPHIATLRTVSSASREALRSGTLEPLQTVLDASVGAADLEGRLWNALVASVVAPRAVARDRGPLIELLRATWAIRERRNLTDPATLARLMASRPRLPSALFADKAAPPAKPGRTSGVRKEQPDSVVKRVREEFRALDDALADLSSASREVTPPGEPKDKPDTPPASKCAGTVTDSMSAGRRRTLSAGAAGRLKASTRKQLSSLGLSATGHAGSVIRMTVEAEKRRRVAMLVRTGGIQALIGLAEATAPPPASPPSPQSEAFDEPLLGSVGTAHVLGYGDLLVVKETLLAYEPAEVAYIENVLKSERKERIYRRLDREVVTYTTSTTTTEETQRDLQTTERYELQSEVASTLARDSALSAGVDVSASYGPVKVAATASYAVNTAQSDAKRTASTYAQEVTERSVERLTRSVTESVTRTLTTEVEETNTHGFDNTAGPGHVTGIYRWVDRRSKAQVYNYGTRLMIEFIVPEPAAFLTEAHSAGVSAAVTAIEPEPLPDTFQIDDVTPDTYLAWVRKYAVQLVDPPPPAQRVVAAAVAQPETVHDKKNNDYILVTLSGSITLPEGYVAASAYVTATWTAYEGYALHVVVGRARFFLETSQTDPDMDGEEGDVPYVVRARDVAAFAMTVEVECERTAATLAVWQLATYQSIVAAYQQLKSKYDSQIAAATIQAASQSRTRASTSLAIQQDELRKGCLVLLTGQHFADLDAIEPDAAPYGFPEIRLDQAAEEGPVIQFHEQCFEWEQMTWLLYPYFWSRKENWVERSTQLVDDATATAFLKAGAARVVVPVRPGYEEAFAWFLATGDVWMGGEPPVIDDEMYVSLIEELMTAQDVSFDDATPWGAPWEVVVPTSLVILQEDAVLPTWPEEGA